MHDVGNIETFLQYKMDSDQAYCQLSLVSVSSSRLMAFNYFVIFILN